MSIYYNLARMFTETTGDSDVTLTTAVPGCKTFADAGCSDSGTYEYGLITYDTVTHRPTGSEAGLGKYISSGTVFKRTTVYSSTDSDDSAIDLSGLTEIYLGPTAKSFNTGFNPFSSYYQNGAATSINNDSDAVTLDMDTEWVDADGISSLLNDTVTISEPGWYMISGAVGVTAGVAFNGYIDVYTTQHSGPTRGHYVTADAFTSDTFILMPVLIQVTSTVTVIVKLDNHSGQTVTATVFELTIEKKSNL